MNQINKAVGYGYYGLPVREGILPLDHPESAKNVKGAQGLQQKPRSGALLGDRTQAIAKTERPSASQATTGILADDADLMRAVDLWGDAVLRLALCKTQNRFDAEDVAQTVFLKLCQSNPNFESEEHQKAWLLKVTLRCSIDSKRDPWEQRKSDTETAKQAIEQMSVSRDEIPFCDAEVSERKSFVEQAVASLPKKQRLAVHLHYFECYSTQEIAQIMDEKASTVRSHLRRARMALKTMIGGNNE